MSESNRRTWGVLAVAFIVIEGLGQQMRGPLLAEFGETFGVGSALLGLVAPAGTVGFVLAVLGGGVLLGRNEPKHFLLTGSAVMALALLVVGLAPTFLVLLGGFTVRALATGTFRAADKPVLSHLFAERRGRVLNLYELAWSVGAAAGPVLATVVLAVGSWRLAYGVLVLLLLPVVVMVWRTPLSIPGSGEKPFTLAGLRTLAGRPAVVGMTVALATSGGIEGAVFLWLPTYLRTIVDPATANLALSAYILTYVPARAVYTLVVDRVGYLNLLVVAAAGLLPLFAAAFGLVGSLTGLEVIAAAVAAGFFVAGLFPTLAAYGVAAAPEYSGPVNGLSLAASYAGGTVSPVVVGVVTAQYSIRTGMQTVVVLAAVFLAVVVGLRVSGATVRGATV
ncbi:MFS transporter [Natronomonas sp. EA1]|uniref:MFS transporter n=1 Tax=Natronomonas sp. EA1 TaxID=3421655 RepID=UPI003EBAD35A